MGDTTQTDQKDKQKPDDTVQPVKGEKDQQAALRLSDESWQKKKAADSLGVGDKVTADRIEAGKPFAAQSDAGLRSTLEKWTSVNQHDVGSVSPLARFESFMGQINELIKEKNSSSPTKIPELDKERYGRVLSVVEKYQDNLEALKEASKKNDTQALDRLLKEQETLKKQMESKEFKQDLEKASADLNSGFNALRGGLSSNYNELLQALVENGRKVPLEQFPQELPKGIRGLAISNEQFKSLVSQGQLKLPERTLAPGELPNADDMREVNKLLRFTDAASQEIHRGMLEQQYALAQSRLNQIDNTGTLSKKWFPDKVENLNDDAIEKKLAAATPWIQKGLEVQRYAELHHRFNKMVNEQFNAPSWLGGIPSKWDSSAIDNNKDVVTVAKDEKTGKVNIAVMMPDSLDRNDANTDRIRKMDDWLEKFKPPVDQALGSIDGAKADNAVVYWGEIKTEMRIDKDGNMLEKGWKDAQGRQVFQESDGRKFRDDGKGGKEWVATTEKLTDADYRIINGKPELLKPGEEVKDINVMSFSTEAKEAKGPDGEPTIEIKQVQNLQYAHFLSYNNWGWVSDVKSMGADIKAQKLDKDTSISEEIGAAGGRRDGKKGDYLVTLPDGRQQMIDEKSFEKLYRPKDGKPGEFEEKPKVYKPDDWLVVYRTDSGGPQPTLMQAKDVPAFCSSQKIWQRGTKVVTTAIDGLMLVSGVAEVRAAMIGVEATAGTAVKLTTTQVLGKALLTRQGMTGLLHAGFGATGFMGQGIENLGPAGKKFMWARGMAMMADLGYTSIGRPWGAKAFVPTAEQIAAQGTFSRGLLNFSQVFSGESLIGRVQAGGADLFFLTDIGVRQLPGIMNRARGTDAQQVQQQAALDRRWPQSASPEDRKVPSSFDKQTLLRIDAFRKPTEDALKLPENDPKRVELNKKLIDTLKDERADSRDRFGAAFALVSLNMKDGKLPEEISAADSSIDRQELQRFVDSQRYLQAKEVLDGYVQNLKLHVSADTSGKLDKLSETAKLAMSDKPQEREAALATLVSNFKSSTASPEEKLLAASAILFARRSESDGKLSQQVKAGEQEIKAKELVDFLYATAQANKGSAATETANPGHMRLYAGDMLLRLDTDRFSMADMSQICLSIVNDKNAPSDPAAKERWTQLKLQAMTDAHGYRLGDIYELMKSRVEPEIAGMPSNDATARQAKGQALASLQGRDSEAIRKTMEALRNSDDARIAGLSSYILYASSAANPSQRIEGLQQLQKPGSAISWPQDFSKDSQNRWLEAKDAEILSKMQADLPGQAGAEYDRASWDKFRAAQELIAKNSDLKANPAMQSEINNSLMSLISSDNPALAAKALPLLISRMQVYGEIFKQMKPEEMNDGTKDLRNKLFGQGAILETLRDNGLDMLKDSSTYASYTARAENLNKDLQKMQTEYAIKRDQLSETQKAQTEAKIAELAQAAANAGNAPGDLKKSLLQSLPAMVNLLNQRKAFGLTDAEPADLRMTLSAIQDLCQVQQGRPETASPELRAQAISTLAELGKGNLGASTLLSRVLSEDPSPAVRLAALDSLKKLAPENLQRICLKQLAVEQHPELAKRLREVEYTQRRPDPDSAEYKEKFNQARLDLINQSARSLTGAEDYLKSNSDLKFLDGQTLRLQALADLNDTYFNGIGGFFRYAWDGNSGVDAEHAKLLEKYAGYMHKSMDALGTKAATDDEALKALVYIALSNGRPLLKDDRRWGADKATEKLKEICQNASPERAKQIAWAVENLMLHQPMMSAAGRQNILDGLKALVAKPEQAGLSNSQVAALVATTLQRDLRNTPAVAAPDFATREKLQLDMLKLLSDERFKTKEILPVLEALSDGSAKFQISRDRDGSVTKVQYPDGSSREVQTRAGVPFRYIFKDSAGKETVWTTEAGKTNTWYKDSDKEKKEPWVGSGSFDANGNYVRINEKTGMKSVFAANGSQVDSVNDKLAKVTMPDGSSREFDPPGNDYRRMTYTSADAKTKEIWDRDGNSNTFYKADDKEKKNPWTGQELLDPVSGDYVSVQGDTRIVRKANGARLEIKDGTVKELAAASDVAYNTSLASVRQKAQEMLSQLADRSEIIRQQATLPDGTTAAQVSKRISDELSNPNASSERVGKAIAFSEKLGAIKDDNDPRRAVLQVAARDGHELVRLMAARELAKSSNADDRTLAFTTLSRLEKQGSRPGYVNESHELITQILASPQTTAQDKTTLQAARQDAAKLDPGSYQRADRSADVSADLDYQDAFERASIELKENALRRRNLSKYEGPDNWFSKSENYNLLDADKLREAQGKASDEAFPGFIPWIFTSSETIKKNCDNAVKEVWNRQERQLTALGEQAKLAGDAGKEAREALASIILTQGQPLPEWRRVWAMQEAAKMIRNSIKEGQPGSRDMIWAVQAALIEEPSLNPSTRFYLMDALAQAKERGIIDAKEASITMAAALESEYQGMPSKTRAPGAYDFSLTNQKYAMSLISLWGSPEASPVLQALAQYHPDATVRQRAKDAFELMKLRMPRAQQRSDAGAVNPNSRADAGSLRDGNTDTASLLSPEKQLAFNQLEDQILELQRIRLRLPQGSSTDQIQRALQSEEQNT